MFRITAESSRSFTLAEILIMAAMNVETTRLASGASLHTSPAERRGYVSASQFVYKNVRKAMQL